MCAAVNGLYRATHRERCGGPNGWPWEAKRKCCVDLLLFATKEGARRKTAAARIERCATYRFYQRSFRYRQPLVHALARRVWQFLSSLHSTSNETNAFKYRHTSSGRAAACYPVTSVVSVSSLVYGLVWSSPAGGRGLERVAACSVGACGMRTMYRGARMGYEWPVTDSISAAAL